jgi:hypothetical protein
MDIGATLADGSHVNMDLSTIASGDAGNTISSETETDRAAFIHTYSPSIYSISERDTPSPLSTSSHDTSSRMPSAENNPLKEYIMETYNTMYDEEVDIALLPAPLKIPSKADLRTPRISERAGENTLKAAVIDVAAIPKFKTLISNLHTKLEEHKIGNPVQDVGPRGIEDTPSLSQDGKGMPEEVISTLEPERSYNYDRNELHNAPYVLNVSIATGNTHEALSSPQTGAASASACRNYVRDGRSPATPITPVPKTSKKSFLGPPPFPPPNKSLPPLPQPSGAMRPALAPAFKYVRKHKVGPNPGQPTPSLTSHDHKHRKALSEIPRSGPSAPLEYRFKHRKVASDLPRSAPTLLEYGLPRILTYGLASQEVPDILEQLEDDADSSEGSESNVHPLFRKATSKQLSENDTRNTDEEVQEIGLIETPTSCRSVSQTAFGSSPSALPETKHFGGLPSTANCPSIASSGGYLNASPGKSSSYTSSGVPSPRRSLDHSAWPRVVNIPDDVFGGNTLGPVSLARSSFNDLHSSYESMELPFKLHLQPALEPPPVPSSTHPSLASSVPKAPTYSIWPSVARTPKVFAVNDSLGNLSSPRLPLSHYGGLPSSREQTAMSASQPSSEIYPDSGSPHLTPKKSFFNVYTHSERPTGRRTTELTIAEEDPSTMEHFSAEHTFEASPEFKSAKTLSNMSLPRPATYTTWPTLARKSPLNRTTSDPQKYLTAHTPSRVTDAMAHAAHDTWSASGRLSPEGMKAYAEAMDEIHEMDRMTDFDAEIKDALVVPKHELINLEGKFHPNLSKVSLTTYNNRSWPMKKKTSVLRRLDDMSDGTRSHRSSTSSSSSHSSGRTYSQRISAQPTILEDPEEVLHPALSPMSMSAKSAKKLEALLGLNEEMKVDKAEITPVTPTKRSMREIFKHKRKTSFGKVN